MNRRRRPQGGGGVCGEQHQTGKSGKNQRGQQGGREAQGRTGPLGCRSCLGGTQAGRRGDQHGAGHAAADRGLGQRHVHRREAHPDERQQQAKCHEADDSREGRPGADGPDGDAQHQQGQSGIERQRNGHARCPPRRMVRAIIWLTVAPANWASSQTATSFSAAR